MTDPGFSSKRLYATAFRTLGARVFFVVLIFLVLPLSLQVVHALLEGHGSHRKYLFTETSDVAKAGARSLSQYIHAKLEELEILSALVLEGKEEFPTRAFEELMEQRYVSYAFVEAVDAQGNVSCVFGAPKNAMDCQAIFPREVLEAIGEGQNVFIGVDPHLHTEQMYISKMIGVQEAGTASALTVVIDLDKWFSAFSTEFSQQEQYHLFILDKEGKSLFSYPAEASLEKTFFFPVNVEEENAHAFAQIRRTQEGKQYMRISKEVAGQVGIEVPMPYEGFRFLAARSISAFAWQLDSESLQRLLSFFLIYLAVGGGIALFGVYRMSRPLKALCQTMERIGRGETKARYVPDRMGFEVNILGREINHMVDSLLTLLETVKNERVEKELLVRELKIGQEIQASLFPKELPHFPTLDVATGYFPAKEVGGDFYDLFSVAQGKELIVTIADAAGKGVSACLYALTLRSMLRSYETCMPSLSDVVMSANALFCKDTADSGAFVTTWIGVFHPETKRLRFHCAGHLPAFLRHKDGSFEELSTPGMALGAASLEAVHISEKQLASGDELILFTDGLIEAENAKQEAYGKERLIHFIRTRTVSSAKELVWEILKETDLFCKGTLQSDDITLLVLRIP